MEKTKCLTQLDVKLLQVMVLLLCHWFILPTAGIRASIPPGPGYKTASDSQKPVIIFKADDFGNDTASRRFIDYLETHPHLRASLGINAYRLLEDSFRERLIELSQNPQLEIWNHGWTHSCVRDGMGEFLGKNYEVQLLRLRQSQQLIRDKLGIRCRIFGAPCNGIDENTSRAMADIDEFDIWLYGKSNTNKFCLKRTIDIEYPTMRPNYEKFTAAYNKLDLEHCYYLLLQLHPPWWDDNDWSEFEKILDFLYRQDVVFMTITGYYQSVTETINVSHTGNTGPGSLRKAVDRANQNTLNKKETVIILPAGTYYLSGTGGENNNKGGDLDISADLTIRGAGESETIIDGGGNDRVMDIHNGRVNIVGVTIRGGKSHCGAGIRVEGGIFFIGDSTIAGNSIVDRGAREDIGGGGIYIKGAKATVTRCKIMQNTGASVFGVKGGGVWINHPPSGKPIDIRDTLFENNTANTYSSAPGWGGGAYLQARDTGIEVALINNTFRGNTAGKTGQGEGGGLYLNKIENIALFRNRFLENRASTQGNGFGGALYGCEVAAIAMTNNLLAKNQAATAGEGIYVKGPSTPGSTGSTTWSLLYNTLADNKPANRTTGGECIYVCDYATLDFTGNIISGHTGGITVSGGPGAAAITADYNIFYNTVDAIVGFPVILQNPNLTSEFKLRKNSPAVDAGKAIPAVTRDLDGNVRPTGAGYDIGCREYYAAPAPYIILSRTLFNFAENRGLCTDSQWLRVSQGGAGTLNWQAESTAPWLHVSPADGIANGMVSISVDAADLQPGSYTGSIHITDPQAANSPQTVTVNLEIFEPGLSTAPFGFLESPADGTTGVSGTLPVTGWVLDDIQVESVKIYLEQGEKLVYIGNGFLVEGARPDVEYAYPGYPFCQQAGWGYMMLTNYLPGHGNGAYTIQAAATDREGNCVTLGKATITCDNANAVQPFGALDTPGPGAVFWGGHCTHMGWALCPLPQHIPPDGSTIDVVIDGINRGHPRYGLYRKDIADLFPGYANSNAGGADFKLPANILTEGLHTIHWIVKDSAGHMAGIGSRYFQVNFSDIAAGLNLTPAAYTGQKISLSHTGAFNRDTHNWETLRADLNPVWVAQGDPQNARDQIVYPNTKSNILVKIKEVEWLKIRLSLEKNDITGYMVVGNRLRPLPVGSTLDMQTGTFYWHPGPGFLGKYHLVFLHHDEKNEPVRQDILVEITLKY
ncbi:MAG: hypothetical protein NT166_29515 [Candidatus Aminicenantes bacterium]|nr:hypothetical protein [Candidatus Aminicenantes bacterium]